MALAARQYDPDIDHDWGVIPRRAQNRVHKKSTTLWKSPSPNTHERIKDRCAQQDMLKDQKCETHLGAA
jgi:hypothetical protein